MPVTGSNAAGRYRALQGVAGCCRVLQLRLSSLHVHNIALKTEGVAVVRMGSLSLSRPFSLSLSLILCRLKCNPKSQVCTNM